MRTLVVLLLSASLASPALAEIYKWTDEKGVIHYADKKPADTGTQSAPKVEQVELSPIQIMSDGSVKNTNNETIGLLVQVQDYIAETLADWRGEHKTGQDNSSVEIYTTAWCGACKAAKAWLRDNNIRYREYDVEKNRSAALRMRELGGGGGVPFAVINGEKVQGFNAARYQAALH